MNTTVESLQALYVKLGGSIEDVADKTTIPEMLDAITLISGTDKPEIDGISINGGAVVTPDENGIIDLTIGDGSTAIDPELSPTSTNPVQNKIVTGEINSLNESVTALNGSLGDVRTPSGINLIDESILASGSGIVYSGSEYIGTADAFKKAFTSAKPIPVDIEDNTKRYTLSFKAYTDGNVSTSGNGLQFRLLYSDGTYQTLNISNSISEWHTFVLTSGADLTKSIVGVYFDYGSAGTNVFHVKELMLNVGTSALEYVPYYTANDKVARKSIGESIGDLSDLKTTNNSDIVSAVNEIFLGTTDITNNLSFITGSSIQEDGTIINNNYGRYTKDIKVREEDICIIVLENTTTSTQNVRFFGYDEYDAFVGQLLLVSMLSKAQNTAKIVIPSEVAYVKVSLSTTVNILSFIVKRGEVKSSNRIFVGSPHVYLSEQIEDEILDSTTCNDVYALYDSMCSNHPETFVRLPDIGVEASANLPIRMYRMKWTNPVMVSKEASWDVADNIYTDVYDDYRKILVTSGTHGNEKSSVYGVALAIQEILDSDKEFAKYIRANFVIDIIPIVNPSGYNATTRNNANNININRDFLTRSTPEAQAVYNVLTNGDYYACIDSHNSGGNANYIGITETNPWRNSFISIGMKFGQMMYNDWKTITTGDQYAISPYMQFWLNKSEGMLQDLFTDLGQLGYLIETVGVFKSGIGTLTPNHKKYCKFTKDMLINSIIVLGSNNFSS